MKKLVFFTLISLFTHVALFAQSTPNITDLLVSTVIQVDSITGLPIENEGELLSVNVKLENIEAGQTIHVLLGTSQDSGNVISWQNTITQNGDSFFIMSTNENREISSNSIEIVLNLSETECENFVYLSLYAESSTGQASETLYFEK